MKLKQRRIPWYTIVVSQNAKMMAIILMRGNIYKCCALLDLAAQLTFSWRNALTKIAKNFDDKILHMGYSSVKLTEGVTV